MARVCWVSCLMGTWWAAAPESLWGSQGCSHSTGMTCLLLSCFQLPQLARQVPCPCKLPSFCCMSKISTANVTFNTSRGAWKCCSNYQDEMQPNQYWVFAFSSLLTADVARCGDWSPALPRPLLEIAQKASNLPSSQAQPHTWKSCICSSSLLIASFSLSTTGEKLKPGSREQPPAVHLLKINFFPSKMGAKRGITPQGQLERDLWAGPK